MRSLKDDGTLDENFISYNIENKNLSLAPNGTVFVPPATQAASAARKEDVDAKVSKSGDTMTGKLTVAPNIEVVGVNPRYILTDGDASPDSGRWDIYAANDALYIRSLTDAGAQKHNNIILRADGSVDMRNAAQAQVPANSGTGAVNQAARITARNPATGQLQIDGVECGQTPWIDVPLLNGWQFIPDGYLRAKRIGNIVWLEADGLDGSAATSNQLTTMPAGFRPETPQPAPANRGVHFMAYEGLTVVATPSRGHISSGGQIQLVRADHSDASFHFSFFSHSSFPATLPT